jgi:hypothetical protein
MKLQMCFNVFFVKSHTFERNHRPTFAQPPVPSQQETSRSSLVVTNSLFYFANTSTLFTGCHTQIEPIIINIANARLQMVGQTYLTFMKFHEDVYGLNLVTILVDLWIYLERASNL